MKLEVMCRSLSESPNLRYCVCTLFEKVICVFQVHRGVRADGPEAFRHPGGAEEGRGVGAWRRAALPERPRVLDAVRQGKAARPANPRCVLFASVIAVQPGRRFAKSHAWMWSSQCVQQCNKCAAGRA